MVTNLFSGLLSPSNLAASAIDLGSTKTQK
jgi:hypothetical protein